MIVLASASAARIRLLGDAGVTFQHRNHRANEEIFPPVARPSEVVLHIAAKKALSMDDISDEDVVIGSDQVLDFDGQILPKAKSIEQLRMQLLVLRGNSHFLHSAAVCVQERAVIYSVVSSAKLKMRSFSEVFLEDYLAKHGLDVLDCVGGYKIEAEGVQLFDEICGDTFTIQGMPLIPVLNFLRSSGHLAT